MNASSTSMDYLDLKNWTEAETSTVGENSTFSGMGRYNWKVPGPLKWYSIVHITLLLVVLLFTVLNGLTLWIIQRTKNLRTPFNTLVSAMLLLNIPRSMAMTIMEIAEIYWNFSIQNRIYCVVKILIRGFLYHFALVMTVAIALLRAYVCIKASMLKLKQTTIRNILVIGCFLAGLLTIPNLLPGSSVQRICLAIMPFTGDSSLSYFPLIKMFLTILLFIVVFVSYTLIAYFIKMKKRNFKVGKNELFTLKAGILLSCVFAFTYISPFIGGIMVVIPGVRRDLLQMVNMVRFFTNLTFLDTIVMPLMFLTQKSQLRRRVMDFIGWLSMNASSSVAPTSAATQVK